MVAILKITAILKNDIFDKLNQSTISRRFQNAFTCRKRLQIDRFIAKTKLAAILDISAILKNGDIYQVNSDSIL